MSNVSDPGQGSEQEQDKGEWAPAGQPEAGAPGAAPGQPAGGWKPPTGPPKDEGQPSATGWPGYPGYGPASGYGPVQGAAPHGWYYRPNPSWEPEGQQGGWDPSRGAYWGPGGTQQQWLWGPPPEPPATNRRERRRRAKLTAAVAGAAVVAGAVAGVGIGHVTWAGSPATPAAVSVPAGSGSTSGGSGSTGSGSTGSGSSGGGFSGLNPGSGNSGSGNSGSGFGGNGFGGGGFSGNGFGGNGNGSGFGGSGSSGSSGSGSGQVSSSPGSPSDVSTIDKKVTPGLVDINLTLGYQSEEAAGTGMVLTSSGEILTNNHVVEGATSISVTDLANSKTYTAKVLGYDATADVAVLQLNGASNLQTVQIGNSDKAAVGEGVVGIGNAGGSGGTPSAAGGAITALNQSITASDEGTGSSEQLTGLIGTDANIESGDSGGPLVNGSGQVLGMDTAGSSSNNAAFSATSGSDQTIGYAIPINTALSVARQITAGQGSSTIHIGPTAFLGIGVESPGQAGNGFGGGGFGGGFSGGFGSSGSGSSSSGSGSSGTTSGAEIANVVNGGAAAQAGLETGDVITSFNGQTIGTPTDLSKALVPLHPGDKVQLTYTDSSGQSHTVSVTLASGPPE
jgi:S1-C subfamily serine protease